MKKILICTPYSGVKGGISQWAKHITNYYNLDYEKDIDLKILDMGRTIYVNNYSNKFIRIKSALIDYKKIINNYFYNIKYFKPDLVHIASSASLSLIKDIIMLKKAKQSGAKTIIHFHFGRIPELKNKNNFEWKILFKVCLLADIVIVMDKQSYNTLINCGLTNIKYLPNPLSLNISKVITSNNNKHREDRKILFAGHIIESKGIFELISACVQIPNIKLTFIGRYAEETVNSLRLIASEKEDDSWVEFLGEHSIERVISEMCTSSIFVLPSYTEGFPNVILESMACGCAIIATRVGAVPEMLDDNCGIIIEPRNTSQLKDALNTLLDDPNKIYQISLNAKYRVNKLYSIPIIWDELVNIWKNS